MKKYRVNTTISQKHHAILKKQAGKLGMQQSVLENALESLESESNRSTELSPEEELWMRIYKINHMLTVLPRDYTKKLFETADIERIREYIENEKPMEFAIEWCYNKSLKECSLKEIIEGIILNIKTQGLDDNINYADGGNHYMINMNHSLGINGSKALIIMNESVLKSYGAKFESNFSKRSCFFKIFKG